MVDPNVKTIFHSIQMSFLHFRRCQKDVPPFSFSGSTIRVTVDGFLEIVTCETDPG